MIGRTLFQSFKRYFRPRTVLHRDLAGRCRFSVLDGDPHRARDLVHDGSPR